MLELAINKKLFMIVCDVSVETQSLKVRLVCMFWQIPSWNTGWTLPIQNINIQCLA